uniref:Uncharacterized protein n=1 Tax=Solanum tuberosum TaxID=4113 RepID=M1DVL6_SOLTU
MPITEHTLFYCHYVTPFKRTRWAIYCQLVQRGILTPIRRDDEFVDAFGDEIWKPCHYHDAVDHNIGMCLGFRYDMEFLINKGKIQVDFPPLADHPSFTRSKALKDSFPGQNSQKEKSAMGDNNDYIGLTEVVVAQSSVVEQNELIMQLMQQIADLKAEVQKKQDLPNPIFSINPLGEGRPPLHFSSPSSNT